MDFIDGALFDEELVLLGEDGAPFFERTRQVAFRSSGPVWPNNHIHVLRPVDGNAADFVAYALNATDFAEFVDGSTRDKLTQSAMNRIPLPWPPAIERLAIVAFLDRETSKIDALMEEQRRLIGLLKEKRQAIISHAVTKGLDPTAKMKPSGVEWLGDVPAHWNVLPCGYNYEVQLGRMLNDERSRGDDLRPYLRVFDVQWGSINVDDLPSMDFPPEARQRYRLRPGDLLVNEGGSYVGRSAIWHGELEECYYQKALHRLRPRDDLHDIADFLLWVMEAATTIGAFIAGGNQTTIDHLTAEQLRAARLPFPPFQEQVKIAAFVTQATEKLDRLQREAVSAIALLDERRSSLISAVVTGKIDLHEASVEEVAA